MPFNYLSFTVEDVVDDDGAFCRRRGEIIIFGISGRCFLLPQTASTRESRDVYYASFSVCVSCGQMEAHDFKFMKIVMPRHTTRSRLICLIVFVFVLMGFHLSRSID